MRPASDHWPSIDGPHVHSIPIGVVAAPIRTEHPDGVTGLKDADVIAELRPRASIAAQHGVADSAGLDVEPGGIGQLDPPLVQVCRASFDTWRPACRAELVAPPSLSTPCHLRRLRTRAARQGLFRPPHPVVIAETHWFTTMSTLAVVGRIPPY